MLDSTMFSFTWKEFESNRNESFKKMRCDQNFTDVTLICDDDKQIQAHKLLLGSISNFFKKIFLANPHPHPVIFLTGMNSQDLDARLYLCW